tara:strand:- start:1434 stop:1730 length:297 start_codon:yes stop_codon:yes gene_type:complete
MTEDTQNTSSSGNSDWKERELGALWRREGRSQNFLSGMIRLNEGGTEREIKVVVFTNKGKAKNERAPDFIIYQDTPRDEAPIIPEVAAGDSDLPDSLS